MNIITAVIFICLLTFSACAVKTDKDRTYLETSTDDRQNGPKAFSNLTLTIPIEKLVSRADYILFGEVTGVEGQVESLERGFRLPVSTVTIDVSESWKGDISGRFTFKSLGANIDRVDYFSEEMARFSRGETVLVFLARFGDKILPVGHIQGKLNIPDDQLPAFREQITKLIKGDNLE